MPSEKIDLSSIYTSLTREANFRYAVPVRRLEFMTELHLVRLSGEVGMVHLPLCISSCQHWLFKLTWILRRRGV